MNEAFREYAFGRAFNLHLTEKQIAALAALCKGDAIASYNFGGGANGILRRGLVESYHDGHHLRVRPTKAGLLVYQLLVEAGEYAELEAKRQETLEREAELNKLEWDERFGEVTVKLKERHLRDKAPSDAAST